MSHKTMQDQPQDNYDSIKSLMLTAEVDLVVLSRELQRLVALSQRITSSLRESRLSVWEQELPNLIKMELD